MYQKLFSEFILNNGVTVRNRLAVAPLTLFSSNPDGSINKAEEIFLDKRAAGIGLYILGATLVQADGQSFPGQPRAISEVDLPSLQRRADILKAHGAKAILQIHHAGVLAEPSLTGVPATGPSAADGVRELSGAEVQELVDAFARATELAIRSGHDGVEIHGANNYVIQQFYSARTNRRTDEWGGSLENRMRLALAVTDAVCAVRRKLNRTDFIIGYRLSPEEPDENGITMTETLALTDELCKRPLQYLHVSQRNFDHAARRGEGAGQPRLKLIHEKIAGRTALIGVGGLVTGEQLEAALAGGNAEFAAVGKSIMMNPGLGDRLLAGERDSIETEIDPAREDHYFMPDPLWAMCGQAMSWLPPVKGRPRQKLDE